MIQRYTQFWFNIKLASPLHFVYDFSMKIIFMLYSTNISLSGCLYSGDVGQYSGDVGQYSGDAGQYVYCNYLFSSQQHHLFWN